MTIDASVRSFVDPGRRSVRVLVVDDHPIFRRGLIDVINDEPGMMVCGEAANSATAQAGMGIMQVGSAAGVAGGSSTTIDHQALSTHTGMVEDSTGALNIVATVQNTSTSANQSFECETAHLEVVG